MSRILLQPLHCFFSDCSQHAFSKPPLYLRFRDIVVAFGVTFNSLVAGTSANSHFRLTTLLENVRVIARSETIFFNN